MADRPVPFVSLGQLRANSADAPDPPHTKVHQGARLRESAASSATAADDSSVQIFPLASNRIHPSPSPQKAWGPTPSFLHRSSPANGMEPWQSSGASSAPPSPSHQTTESQQLLHPSPATGGDGHADTSANNGPARATMDSDLLKDSLEWKQSTTSNFLGQPSRLPLSGKKRRQSLVKGLGLRPGSRRSLAQRMAPALELISKGFNRAFPVTSPNTRKRRWWDLLSLVMVMYNAICVPYDAAFTPPTTMTREVLGYIIDALFLLDVCLTFRTAYVNIHGHLVLDGKDVATHYLKTWFLMDLMASLPFELLAPLFSESDGHLKLLAFLKTPRLLRLGRLMRIFERMRNANVIRILRLTIMMCLFGHWAACGWQLLALAMPHERWSFEPEMGRSYNYVLALYGSLQLMVGNGITTSGTPERIFVSVVLLLGACFYAIVVGNMSVLVSNLNATAARHRQRQDMVVQSARYLALPAPIQERIQGYYEHLITYSHPGREGMAMLADLPDSLYSDIIGHLSLATLAQVPVLLGCEPAFLRKLALHLRVEVCCFGETLFHSGDAGHEMFFISKGHMAVVNSHGELSRILGSGDFFGDVALLGPSIRSATCVALTHCDLHALHHSALHAAMKDFPISAEIIRRHARDTLKGASARVNGVRSADLARLSGSIGGVPVDSLPPGLHAGVAPPGVSHTKGTPIESQPAPASAVAARRAKFTSKAFTSTRATEQNYDFLAALAVEQAQQAAVPDDPEQQGMADQLSAVLHAVHASQEAILARLVAIDQRLTRMDADAGVTTEPQWL
ncbi:hypothetical protein WJX72_009567 [[Myrmecia] bisecta]|uniref:Cyclic nucleotide-binding domain-containing protein n=1 Tax=[Myrmecia] bisecta TaxID=41462 RepID=A0AAW1QS90_9CHLO